MSGLGPGMAWGSLRGDAERASRAGGPPSVISVVPFLVTLAASAFLPMLAFPARFGPGLFTASLMATADGMSGIASPGVVIAAVFVAVFAVPVAVMTFGQADQAPGNPASFNPTEITLGAAGTVPAIRPAAPVPAALEEHFLLETCHDLDARGHEFQLRQGGQSERDANPDLGLGSKGAEAQKRCEWEGEFSHGRFS